MILEFTQISKKEFERQIRTSGDYAVLDDNIGWSGYIDAIGVRTWFWCIYPEIWDGYVVATVYVNVCHRTIYVS